MEGGTSFHFVTEGFEAAYAQARETAGEDGIDIAGGASTVRQALAAGVIDELTLDVVPVLFGSGERLFDGVESLGFEPVEVIHSPLATHIRYRRKRGEELPALFGRFSLGERISTAITFGGGAADIGLGGAGLGWVRASHSRWQRVGRRRDGGRATRGYPPQPRP